MKGKSLIRNSFAVLGIAVGLILISAIPAHATIINRDYEPTFDYQYGEHVNESLGYTATQTVTSHPIGASDLNFGASSNYDLEITGTAQPVGKYELDISSSSIQVFDPAVMLYLNIKIKANVYLPYTIRYVDGSGNLLLTDSGKLYQDNKWENAKLEFIATSSDAGQKISCKGYTSLFVSTICGRHSSQGIYKYNICTGSYSKDCDLYFVVREGTYPIRRRNRRYR